MTSLVGVKADALEFDVVSESGRRRRLHRAEPGRHRRAAGSAAQQERMGQNLALLSRFLRRSAAAEGAFVSRDSADQDDQGAQPGGRASLGTGRPAAIPPPDKQTRKGEHKHHSKRTTERKQRFEIPQFLSICCAVEFDKPEGKHSRDSRAEFGIGEPQKGEESSCAQ